MRLSRLAAMGYFRAWVAGVDLDGLGIEPGASIDTIALRSSGVEVATDDGPRLCWTADPAFVVGLARGARSECARATAPMRRACSRDPAGRGCGRLAFVVVSSVLLAASAGAQGLARGEVALELLAQPGHHLLMRHALAPRSGDPRDFAPEQLRAAADGERLPMVTHASNLRSLTDLSVGSGEALVVSVGASGPTTSSAASDPARGQSRDRGVIAGASPGAAYRARKRRGSARRTIMRIAALPPWVTETVTPSTRTTNV